MGSKAKKGKTAGGGKPNEGAGGAQPFARDFGYLMPFLDKVEAATGSIADPAAREEAKRLLSGEKERWTRARELLAGAPGGARAGAAKPATAPPPPPPPPPPAPKPSAGLTVGSLRGLPINRS